jgi:hypothetical protein
MSDEPKLMFDDEIDPKRLPSERDYDIWIWNLEIGPTPFGIPRTIADDNG